MRKDYELDVFGQQPGLHIYTQLCVCFPVADASSHPAIVKTLTSGLERLSASFPWIAGKVVNEGLCEGNTGIFKIKPFEKTPRLIVKDLRHDASIPTMDVLRYANFPFHMLDESIIAPRNTLPGGAESDVDPTPVFLLQANFITGGLLLTFAGQHQAMDMTGQANIIHFFSKACHDEPFTTEELASGNIDRRNVIPLLDDSYEPGPEMAHLVVKSSPITQDATDHSPPTWAYFTFSSASLCAMKSVAAETIPLAGYASTDDALSALIWKSVTRARLSRLNSTSESTFARAVDPRRFLGIPQTYCGLVQNMTYHKYSLQKLVDEPLGSIASQLRLAVDPKTSNLGYTTSALATFLNRASDKSRISVTATLDLSVDIMLSSWAKLDCYELDFNLGLGKPESVRRPRFTPVESLMYVMPRSLDGEMAVGMCLRDEDLDRLRTDEEFGKYATYIG